LVSKVGWASGTAQNKGRTNNEDAVVRAGGGAILTERATGDQGRGMPSLRCAVTSACNEHVAYQLDEKLGLEAPVAFHLAVGALRQQRIDLVDEDDGGLVAARHREQGAHQLLTLAHLCGNRPSPRAADVAP